MESSIFRFVLRFSLREQAFLLALTIVSYPFFFLSLDLPKTIINEAIDTDTSAFPWTSSATSSGRSNTS